MSKVIEVSTKIRLTPRQVEILDQICQRRRWGRSTLVAHLVEEELHKEAQRVLMERELEKERIATCGDGTS